MAAEDDDPEASGPPPDPSLRAWRHPSEVAAANAAAARDLAPPRRRRWSPSSFAMGGLFGALAAVAIIASTTSAFDPDDPTRVEFRPSPVAADDEAAPSVEDNAESSDGDAPDSGADSEATPGNEGSDQQASDDNQAESDSGTLVPTSTSGLVREPVADELEGVLSLFHLDGVTPVASAVVIDGMVLTSASALGGAERVVYIRDGESHEATVVGADPFTDVAVLQADDPWGLTSALPGKDPAELHEPVRLVASDGQPAQIVVAGKVIGIDESAETKDGHPVIGMLYTSARVPEQSGGAALINEDDEVIGLVIDSEHYLAVAVPIETARTIGLNITATGHASASWVGIEGSGSEDGVSVTLVSDDSPASDAGLAIDDVIISVNDYPVTRMADIINLIRATGPGGEVALEVTTGEQSWSTTLVVGSRP